MALVKQTLSAAILTAMQKQFAKNQSTDNPAQAQQEFADDLATAIDAYIKTSTVIIPALPVSGAVAGPGTGTIQ